MFPLIEPLPPDPTCARYTAHPFPPYRYVPRLNPHPCADPRGHSYTPPGAPPHRPPLPPPDEWRRCLEYLHGADLYNFAYWWEAHETWESVWQSADKAAPQGRFLQSLIQIAAAHLQRHVGALEGAQRLIERSAAHLDFVQPRVPPVFMGLELADFRRRVEAWFADAPGSAYPFIWLRDRAPK